MLALLALLGAVEPASAQTRRQAVITANTLTCAAELRPGFADADDQGQVTGVAVDLCRDLAARLIGPAALVRVTVPQSEMEFAPVADGRVDVAFLSDDTVADQALGPRLMAGPVVFRDPVALMVPEASAVRTPRDLAGRTVCVITGSTAQRVLEAGMAAVQPPIVRQAFREDVEMLDAYNVGQCDAAVDDASRLAEMRQSPGINALRSRVLAPPLALIEVRAMTPAGDADWAAVVAQAWGR